MVLPPFLEGLYCFLGLLARPRPLQFNFWKTLELLQAFLAVDRTNAKAFELRGKIYAQLDKHRLAIEDYSQALRLPKCSSHVYAARGRSYALMQEWELALADFDKTLQFDPQHASSYYSRGLIYERLGNCKQASRDFAKACRLGDTRACDKRCSDTSL